ncbi:rhomboid family intramembrane serine protease [Niabella ginsengisoli]|uniref:Rhomboid family intramembrane serine protease n=1 Tax=Niabella ginsengisoli TaxID=522298 RepID=A0ABS9SMN7_9BACT|nr:rhomboid family intramembrane serine protease [Niabella ginsengisoli]MCH5599632.1 rhomboid family intramembrane serine protease [Niabella ginsengisoli]
MRLPEGGDVTGVFNKNVLSWFALSDDAVKTLSKPWTVLTYSFVHTSIWQLFASLLWLWSFGYILIDLTGFKKIVPVFIYGTLAGAAAYLIAKEFMPVVAGAESQYFLGSGAAILAVCTAATTICPNYKIFPMLGGGISLWILSIVYLAIDMATLPANGPALYVANIAGAVAGFLFIFLLRRGMDGSDWMNNLYDWFSNLFNPEKPQQKRNQIKSTLFYNAAKAPFSKTPKLTQQKLDEILDKINQSGYDNLSVDEKDFLKRVSNDGG